MEQKSEIGYTVGDGKYHEKKDGKEIAKKGRKTEVKCANIEFMVAQYVN